MGFFNDLNIGAFLREVVSYIDIRNPLDAVRAVIDIGIVSYVIYKVILLVRETRALQVIRGILVLLVVEFVSGLLGLKTIEYILQKTFQYIAIALVVLFQPELRRGLEQIGRSKFKSFFIFDEDSIAVKTASAIEEIVKASVAMSREFTGALIVIERETRLGEIVNTGVNIDSNVTAELLMNLFVPNTPLHDGAVIIKSNKIKAASCYLPLTDNPNLGKELGTRHRAALGITEITDCIAVVISEESGTISFAMNGGLSRNLTPDTLRLALSRNLMEKDGHTRKLGLWKVKSK